MHGPPALTHSPPAHAHACTQTLTHTQVPRSPFRSHTAGTRVQPLPWDSPPSRLCPSRTLHPPAQLFTLCFALLCLPPPAKCTPLPRTQSHHGTVLSLTCTLTPCLCTFPLAQAPSNLRHKCTNTFPHHTVCHPKTLPCCHLWGWISQGSHLILASILTAEGCCRQAGEPGHCPITGLTLQGPRRKEPLHQY